MTVILLESYVLLVRHDNFETLIAGHEIGFGYYKAVFFALFHFSITFIQLKVMQVD